MTGSAVVDELMSALSQKVTIDRTGHYNRIYETVWAAYERGRREALAEVLDKIPDVESAGIVRGIMRGRHEP